MNFTEDFKKGNEHNVYSYYDLLKEFHIQNKPKIYLEIGVATAKSINLTDKTTKALGIDPEPTLEYGIPKNATLFRTTSDDFFAQHNIEKEFGGKIDAAFIDGMHQYEFAFRDFINVEKNAHKNTVVFVHDTNPKDTETSTKERNTGFWTGDVYKLVLALRKYRPDLKIINTATAPSGLLIVENLNPDSTVLSDNYEKIVEEFNNISYDDIVKDKDNLLCFNIADNFMGKYRGSLFKVAFYASEAYRNNFYKNYEHIKLKDGLKTELIENGLIMPFKNPNYGGVFTQENKLVEFSAVSNSTLMENRDGSIFHSWSGELDNELLEKTTPEFIDKEAVYIGPVHGKSSYGLFILEVLSKMWFFLDDKNKKYTITYTQGNGNSDELFEFFELLGLKREQFIKIEKPTKFKKVIVPEQAFRMSDYITKEYFEVIEAIKKQVPASKFKKVYFSKTEWKNATSVFGEKAIEKTFKKNGYKVFYPETLSIKEQISIIKGCEEFAGVMGTNMHNNIFANDEIKCTYLLRTSDMCAAQLLIDKYKRFKVDYVETYIELFPTLTTGMPCFIGLTPYLRRFLDKENFKYNICDFTSGLNKNFFKFLDRYYSNAKNHITFGQTKKFGEQNVSVSEICNNLEYLFSIYPAKSFIKRGLGVSDKIFSVYKYRDDETQIKRTIITILGIQISYKKSFK